MADNLTTNKELQHMRKVFSAMDRDCDGVLTRQEVIQGLAQMGVQDPEGETARIFAMVDVDGSDKLEFKEWCAAAIDKD